MADKLQTARDLRSAFVTAEAAFQADELSFDKMKAANAAFAAYNDAEGKAEAAWAAIPASDAKDSAHSNADDTDGAYMCRLVWLYFAASTYQSNMDCGDFNADGSSR